MAELKQKVLSGLRWSVGARAASQLATWASTIIVMRLLQPSDYGLMAMAGFFISFSVLINELGMGAAIVQAKELSDRLLRQVFGLVLLSNGIIFVVLIASSPLIAGFFDEPRLVALVSVLALQFPITAVSVIPNALLTRKMDFRSKSIIEIVAPVTNAIVTLILAYMKFGVWALVIGSLVNVSIRTIGLNIISPYLKKPTLNFTDFADRAKFGGYITLQRVLWYVYSQADIFVVGKILGKTILGYYSVAMELARLPLDKVSSIFHQVALPAYSQLQENRELAATYALKASRTISFVAFPIFFGISVVAPELVMVALGDKWSEAILPLQLLSLVISLRAVHISFGSAVDAMGRPDVNVVTLLVACILFPFSFWVGANWGLLGVSLAWMVAYPLWFVYMLSRSLKVIGATMSDFFKTMQVPALYSAVMYGAVYLVKLVLYRTDTELIVILLAMVATGVVVYAGAMLLFSRDSCKELWGIIRG